MAKATIIDYGDPSVGIMQRDYSVDLPFELDEIEAGEREYARLLLAQFYGEFAEGKIVVHFQDELEAMEKQFADAFDNEPMPPNEEQLPAMHQIESYCEGLLSKFKQSPNFDLEVEFGRLLIKPIESLTKEEHIRYNELDAMLNSPAPPTGA